MGYKTIGTLKGPMRGRVVSLAIAATLTEADLGTTYYLATVGKAITIPDATAMEDGGFFEFHIAAAVSSTDWTITSASSDIIGIADAMVSTDDGVEASSAVNTIKFVTTSGKAGTWCRLQVVGDLWIFTGQCETKEGMTIVAV